MKKLMFPLLVAGAMIVPSLAQAESYYVSLSSGLNLLNDATLDYENPAPPVYPPHTYMYKTGVVVNGAVGLKSGDFRFEAEAGFHDNKVDKVRDSLGTYSQANHDFTSWTFMTNGYYDMDWLNASVTPYVMGGLGCARVEINYYPNLTTDPTNSSTETSVVFAWQVGAGIGIKATKDITIDLGYRYLKPVDHHMNTVYGINSFTHGGHEILAGLRYAL